LQHVKPHGALYMTASDDPELSRQLIEALQKTGPDLFIYCMSISETYRLAKEAGQPVIREYFADRDYDESGSIVFARKMRTLNPQEVADKALRACREGLVKTVDGEDIEIPFESICFHSDTPGALAIGTAIRDTLMANGVTIAPPRHA
ncbi:MAG: LamB/YcsF family protein, partial [Pseudomonadota bacterium]